MQKVFAFTLFLFLLAGCGSGTSPMLDHNPMPLRTISPLDSAPAESGIEGQTLLGPGCPVVNVDNPCPDKPYQAKITVTSLEGGMITQFQSDENGHFRIVLAAGDYILHPETDGRYPFAADQQVKVEAGKFTAVTITFYSGIR